MSFTLRVPALAPFQVRSFRYQWPADLLASWAFEMEGVILGWFVLVSTGSVLALAIFGSLQFLGTLISPFFGMAGDRIGNRNLICLMRLTYIAAAALLSVLFLTDQVTPVIVFVIGLQVLLFRSRWGLRTRAVGEHPRAAETVGIDVIRLRYRNVLLGGIFAGPAGAYLSMEATDSFQAGMTNGRGFIALAAVIVGRWTPIGSFGAALLFAFSQAIGQSITFATPAGQLGDVLTTIPAQFYDVLPYIVTIVVLAGVVGRSVPPAADGQPYQREAAS